MNIVLGRVGLALEVGEWRRHPSQVFCLFLNCKDGERGRAGRMRPKWGEEMARFAKPRLSEWPSVGGDPRAHLPPSTLQHPPSPLFPPTHSPPPLQKRKLRPREGKWHRPDQTFLDIVFLKRGRVPDSEKTLMGLPVEATLRNPGEARETEAKCLGP